jgi:hypothetical protein
MRLPYLSRYTEGFQLRVLLLWSIGGTFTYTPPSKRLIIAHSTHHHHKSKRLYQRWYFQKKTRLNPDFLEMVRIHETMRVARSWRSICDAPVNSSLHGSFDHYSVQPIDVVGDASSMFRTAEAHLASWRA